MFLSFRFPAECMEDKKKKYEGHIHSPSPTPWSSGPQPFHCGCSAQCREACVCGRGMHAQSPICETGGHICAALAQMSRVCLHSCEAPLMSATVTYARAQSSTHMSGGCLSRRHLCSCVKRHLHEQRALTHKVPFTQIALRLIPLHSAL